MASKLTLIDISSGFSGTDINTNFTDIEDEFDDTLSRTGKSPNTMEADLDLNSNKIRNLGEPTNNSDAVRLADITDDAKTAKATAVEITDSGGYYASAFLEGVLQELGTLNELTTNERDALKNIDSVTISNTQWGWVGGLGSAPLEDDDLAANGGNVPGVDRNNTFVGYQDFTFDGSARASVGLRCKRQTGGSGGDDTFFDLGFLTANDNITISTFQNGAGTQPVLQIDGFAGITVDNATGGAQGQGTLNAEELYEDGERVGPIARQRVTLGGTFDSGQEAVCERIGNTVTITTVGGVTHTQEATPTSTNGIIPSTYRPSNIDQSVVTFMNGTYLVLMTITTGGRLQFAYRDFSGSLYSTSTGPIAGCISFNVTSAIT